jgi:hypothetical protein
MKSHLQVGMIIRAQYYQDAKYYDARIDEVLSNGKYLVTFTEYGNQEEVPLSSIKLKDVKSRSNKQYEDLDAEILRREREKATASGKGYIKRPSGYANMSMKLGAATNRKRSRSRSPERREVYNARSRSPSERKSSSRAFSDRENERKQRLHDRYGDASFKRH